MAFFDKMLAYWQIFMEKIGPFITYVRSFFVKVGMILERTITGVFKVRKIIATVPVAAGAVYLALYNMSKLPKVVGIDLLENGSFTYQISKGIAVFVPLAITGVCLLLMFCSRRILTPWLVSVFSLLIPIVIWITNVFPA